MLVKATAVAAAVLAVGASACGGKTSTPIQGELAELAGDSSGALSLDVTFSSSPVTGFSLGADQIKIGTEATSLKCAVKTESEFEDVRVVDLSCSLDIEEGRLGATLAIPAVMTLGNARHGKKGTEMNFTAFGGDQALLEVSAVIAPIDCTTSYAVSELILGSEQTTPIPNPMRRSDSEDENSDEERPEMPEDDGETDVSKHHKKKGKHHKKKGKHHKGKHHKGKHHKGKHHKGKHHKDEDKEDDDNLCMVTDIPIRAKYLVIVEPIVDPLFPEHHEEEPEHPKPHHISDGDDGEDDGEEEDEKHRHRRHHPVFGLALLAGVFLAGVFVGKKKGRKAAAASTTATPVVLVAPPRYTALPAEPVEKV